jgi:hypothetical protein
LVVSVCDTVNVSRWVWLDLSRPGLAVIRQQLGPNPIQVVEAQETDPVSDTVHRCPVCGLPMHPGDLILPAKGRSPP